MTRGPTIRRGYDWERKLRPALRGTRGYAVQQAAWDAVLPAWRECLALVDRMTRGPRLTDEERAKLDQLSVALNADNRRLAGPWYQLLMQSMYRGCPALGGWFPE